MEILKKVLTFLDPKHDVDLREDRGVRWMGKTLLFPLVFWLGLVWVSLLFSRRENRRLLLQPDMGIIT